MRLNFDICIWFLINYEIFFFIEFEVECLFFICMKCVFVKRNVGFIFGGYKVIDWLID